MSYGRPGSHTELTKTEVLFIVSHRNRTTEGDKRQGRVGTETSCLYENLVLKGQTRCVRASRVDRTTSDLRGYTLIVGWWTGHRRRRGTDPTRGSGTLTPTTTSRWSFSDLQFYPDFNLGRTQGQGDPLRFPTGRGSKSLGDGCTLPGDTPQSMDRG